MRDISHNNSRDYSGWFLGIVLIGLVMMVAGLMMASARSQAPRGRPAIAAFPEPGFTSKS